MFLIQGEEDDMMMMGVDETAEQYEERVLNKRAVVMHKTMKNLWKKADHFTFSTIINGHHHNRKQVNPLHPYIL